MNTIKSFCEIKFWTLFDHYRICFWDFHWSWIESCCFVIFANDRQNGDKINTWIKFIGQLFPIPYPPSGSLFIELFTHRGESLLSYYQKWSLKFVCYWCGFNVRSCLFDYYHYTAFTNGWMNYMKLWLFVLYGMKFR